METLIRMINIFAWIAVFFCPLIAIVKFILHVSYTDSLEEKIDHLNGVQGTYLHKFWWFVLGFVVSLVYLIAK